MIFRRISHTCKRRDSIVFLRERNTAVERESCIIVLLKNLNRDPIVNDELIVFTKFFPKL